MRAILVLMTFVLPAAVAHASAISCDDVFARASKTEITKTLETISNQEIRQVDKLRDLTFETGRQLGLSKFEVENALATFAESGAIGGRRHVYALFRGVYVKGAYDAYQVAERATKADLKQSFAAWMTPYTQRSSLRARAELMVEFVHGEVARKVPSADEKLLKALEDPRHRALLSLWYEMTLRPMMQTAIDAAPRKIVRQMNDLQYTISNNAKWPTLVGTVGTIAALHPGLMVSAEVVAGGLGMFTAAINVKRLPVFGWLSERFYKAQARHLTAIEPLKRLALEPSAAEKTRIGLPALPAFDFAESFSTFTIPLRAEIAKQEMTIDYETGHTDESLAHVMDSVVPVLRLATDTFTTQVVRLKQVEDKADEFTKKFGHIRLQDAGVDFASADKVDTHASTLRSHLSSLKEDLRYTLFALDRQKKLLRYASEQARKVSPSRAEQLEYFYEYAVEAKSKLHARAITHMKAIDQRLFELNKSILMPF